jgi:hypothetical protein
LIFLIFHNFSTFTALADTLRLSRFIGQHFQGLEKQIVLSLIQIYRNSAQVLISVFGKLQLPIYVLVQPLVLVAVVDDLIQLRLLHLFVEFAADWVCLCSKLKVHRPRQLEVHLNFEAPVFVALPECFPTVKLFVVN